MVYTLEICASTTEAVEYYKNRVNYASDSGVDLYVPEDIQVLSGDTVFVSHQIKCRMLDENGNHVGYYLYPRSSIAKTPVMLANSVGIIDKSYRGNIIAALRYVTRYQDLKSDTQPVYTIEKGSRLVQICGPTLEPIRVKLVDFIDTNTERGEGGFGSTG